MARLNRQYPTPEQLEEKGEMLKKLMETKSTLEGVGVEVSPQILAKIGEVFSQTREGLPKWVTEPKWIEKLEDLKKGLSEALRNLEGKKGAKRQIESLQDQLKKVEEALDDPKEYLGGMSRKAYAETISGSPKRKTGEKELSPEEIEDTLKILEERFHKNMYLHQGLKWEDVKASLEANPEAILSLRKMESGGHEPDVYHDDNDSYYFGTCSKESPKRDRNCVYDKEAELVIRRNGGMSDFNGNAVEMAKAMGIDLMELEHYKSILQKKGKFDSNSSSWLKTQLGIRSTGSALYGSRGGTYVDVSRDYAYGRNASRAWRGSLRVKKLST